VERIEAWLARHSAAGGRVRVTPVVDQSREDAVDRHDPPPWMAEQVRLRDQRCVFPYCRTRRTWRRCAGVITGRRPRSDGATNAPTTALYAWTSPHADRYLVRDGGTLALTD
jgi:hypothetical protein